MTNLLSEQVITCFVHMDQRVCQDMERVASRVVRITCTALVHEIQLETGRRRLRSTSSTQQLTEPRTHRAYHIR